MSRLSIFAIAIVLVLVSLIPISAHAAEISLFQRADDIRVALLNAQLNLSDDPAGAAQDVSNAQQAYAGNFAQTLAKASPDADQRIRGGLTLAQHAVTANDIVALADARSQVWTALL